MNSKEEKKRNTAINMRLLFLYGVASRFSSKPAQKQPGLKKNGIGGEKADKGFTAF